MNDLLKTQLQETGQCRVATLTVLEIADIVESLGLDPRECRIDVSGFLYVSINRLMGGRSVTLR